MTSKSTNLYALLEREWELIQEGNWEGAERVSLETKNFITREKELPTINLSKKEMERCEGLLLKIEEAYKAEMKFVKREYLHLQIQAEYERLMSEREIQG